MEKGLLPNEIIFEITKQCNFHCHNCFNKNSFAKNNRDNKSLSIIEIKEILKNLKNAKIKRVRFTGGEPLMREDLFQILEYSKNLNLEVWLNSNASLVTKKNIGILENLVDNILISFNGIDQESDLAWTGIPDSFYRKINGLNILSKSNIKTLRIGTVLTKNCSENLIRIHKFISQFNFKSWEVYREVSVGEKLKKHTINYFQVANDLIELMAINKKIFQIANAIPFCVTDPMLMSLIALGANFDDGHSRMVIGPDGNVKPSYFIDLDLGNPLEIEKCWEHQFMQKMRNLEFVPNECKNCNYLNKCKGGSRFNGFLNQGDFKAPDQLMNINNLRN